MAEAEVYVSPIKYRVTIIPDACREHYRSDLQHWSLYVRPTTWRSGSGGWLVTDGGSVLGRDGTTDYPSPRQASDGATEAEIRAWLANYRYGTAGEAIAAASAHAADLRINGLTATEVLAKHLAQEGWACHG